MGFSGLAAAQGADPELNFLITCPAELATSESARQELGWIVREAQHIGPLEGITIMNDRPGVDLDPFPPHLKFDESHTRGETVIQIWRLEHYRKHPITLICRYSGTGVKVLKLVPADAKTCAAIFGPAPQGSQHATIVAAGCQ